MIITTGSIVKKLKLYCCHACHAFFHDLTRHHIQIRFKQDFRSRSLRFFTTLLVTVTCTNLNIFHVMHSRHAHRIADDTYALFLHLETIKATSNADTRSG